MGGRDLSCSGSKQRSRGRWAAQHCSSLCMPLRGSWSRRGSSATSCSRRSRRAYRPRRPWARSTSIPFSSKWKSGISRSPARRSEKLLGFERLFVDFDLSSLWHRAYTFGRIELAAPYLNAVVAPDGTLNLAKLAPKTTAAPPAAKREPMPALRVGSFKVTRASVGYDDRSRPSEFSARLEPIDFELRDFTTGVAGRTIHLHRLIQARRADRVARTPVDRPDRIGRRAVTSMDCARTRSGSISPIGSIS